MTNDQGRSSLWIPERNDIEGNFLTHTHTHPPTHTQPHTGTGTQAQRYRRPQSRGVTSRSSGPLGQRRQHLPLHMQDLICEERVCLCKESKKIIVTAYVTGVD